ncbi:MAG: response regulator, partial [Fibrobacteria bacterium]|nr:response regulator [Fibrobacteria bacterium]
HSIGKTVLIAEDDFISFNMIKRTLTKQGYRVLHAENGVEAVKLSKENEIAVILMDMSMPKLNGLEATRQIKTFNSNIKIIAMTGLAMKDDEARIREAGCDYYLSKPTKPEKILEVLNKFIISAS